MRTRRFLGHRPFWPGLALLTLAMTARYSTAVAHVAVSAPIAFVLAFMLILISRSTPAPLRSAAQEIEIAEKRGEQRAFARERGYDAIQGKLFSPAVSAEQFIPLIREEQLLDGMEKDRQAEEG